MTLTGERNTRYNNTYPKEAVKYLQTVLCFERANFLYLQNASGKN